MERHGPPRGPPVDPMAVTRPTGAAPAAGLASPAWGGFERPGRAARPRRSLAQLPDRGQARLADGGELDRPGPVLHLLGRQARLRGADPRRDARHRQRRAAAASTAAVRGRRHGALVVRHGGDRRARLVDPRRPRALPDAEVRLRQPERLPGRPAGTRRRPGRRSARWARSSRSPSGSSLLGVPFDPGVISWLVLVVVDGRSGSASIIAIGVLLAAVCLQTRQESWSYPEAFAGALFLVSGAVFPLVRAARAGPGRRPR